MISGMEGQVGEGVLHDARVRDLEGREQRWSWLAEQVLQGRSLSYQSLASLANMLTQGLGTSTAQDAKKYFSDMSRHRLPFETIEDNDRSLIDMAFNKKKADDRKEWLRGYVVSFDSTVLSVFLVVIS